MEKRAAIILCGHPLEIEVYVKNVRSGFSLHSRIVVSEASVLIELMIKSARNWWLNRQSRWVWVFVLLTFTTYPTTLFAAMD